MLEVEKMRSEYRNAEARHASVSTYLMFVLMETFESMFQFYN